MRRVIVYDFDGTITNKDTFPAFIRHAIGFNRYLITFILFSPILILMKLKIYSADRAKEKIFSFVFKGVNYKQFVEWSRSFAVANRDILRPKAITSINHFAQQENVSIYIVSAGIREWILPFFEELQINAVISTEIEVDSNGRLTGQFKTKNCNRAEKVNRLLLIEPIRDSYELIAYGDSSGDKNMIDFADFGYYNKFV